MNRPRVTWLTPLVAGPILALAGGALAPPAHAQCGSGHGRSSVFRAYDTHARTPVRPTGHCTGPGCAAAEQPPPPVERRPLPCTGPQCTASELPPPVPP